MPTVSINKKEFHKHFDLQLNDEEFSEYLFDYGLELDDIVEEEDEIIYKIEIPANRYDLLCLEGLTQAFHVFNKLNEYKKLNKSEFIYSNIEISKNPDYNFNSMDQTKIIKYKNNPIVIHQNSNYRTYIACAVIRNISFNSKSYKSFIDYQDKLHSSVGRDRSIVAIGTHDFLKIQFPIFYKSLKEDEISFQPLNQEKIMNIKEMLEFYNKDNKMKNYCKLFKNDFPCFIDSNGNVLSLPPLINSEFTKINENTNNIFVEATGTDFYKVNSVLKMILYNFRGQNYNEINIIKETNIEEKVQNLTLCNCEQNTDKITTPIFYNYQYEFTIEEINKELNLNLTTTEVKKMLVKMMHTVEIDGNKVIVKISDVRSDILHKIDIIEDIAVAYGYNNFKRKNVDIFTIGKEDPIIKLGDKIRNECAQAGFNEVLTLSLLSKKDSIGSVENVQLMNPKSLECEVVRNLLLPGILKSVYSNQHVGVPIKVFEVSDIVIIDENNQPKNEKMICACYVGKTDGIDHILGLCSLLMKKLGLDYQYVEKKIDIYFDKRSCEVIVENMVIGTLGVLHPKICNNFKIPFAVSTFEINLNLLYKIYNK